ncbi:hypothetical protein BDV26DRAFT_267003 [Aspergillus bertholletiae]|uniref:Uncharacterized protein n=1 Tax=Aspergillus bertholletiae TaxID=1226010 RepID=A0A5N7B176_9EURO|nr:hypothetical protein BDV26DRAFT_267003 [Aspergillus bertholletiae]
MPGSGWGPPGFVLLIYRNAASYHVSASFCTICRPKSDIQHVVRNEMMYPYVAAKIAFLLVICVGLSAYRKLRLTHVGGCAADLINLGNDIWHSPVACFITIVRSVSPLCNINPGRVGCLGFSTVTAPN